MGVKQISLVCYPSFCGAGPNFDNNPRDGRLTQDSDNPAQSQTEEEERLCLILARAADFQNVA